MATRQRIADLLDTFDVSIRNAFLAAVDDIRNRADVDAIAAALERKDYAAAIAAIHLDPAAFAGFDQALADAFRTGGQVTINGLPRATDANGSTLVIRFDARNLRAEQYLRTYSSTLVTDIIDDQVVAIRAALADGMSQGLNPRQVALDIVGRYDRDLGMRVGGVIGLTSQQEQFAANALAELLSGDPTKLRNYLGRELRDRRFDSIVRKALDDEGPVNATNAARMVQRYRDRLLKMRGDAIGRTEALTSLHAGQNEALEQLAEKGTLPRSAIARVWRSAHDSRVRETHAVLDGQRQPIDKPFQSPSGAFLRYPGDPNAPAAEVIQCRCYLEPAVDFLHGIK